MIHTTNEVPQCVVAHSQNTSGRPSDLVRRIRQATGLALTVLSTALLAPCVFIAGVYLLEVSPTIAYEIGALIILNMSVLACYGITAYGIKLWLWND